MVSGAAGLRAAATIAVFTVLVMSSQGHHPKTSLPAAHGKRRPPLCSDCPSLCNTNCTAVAAANCSSDCGPPPGCDTCKSQVLQGCCQSSCTGSSGTSSSISCCPNDCVGGCNNCTAAANDRCTFVACTVHADDAMRCQACKHGVAQQCYTSCISVCNQHCVKKGC